MVTSVVFQPAAFAAGAGVPVMTGGVSSMLTNTVVGVLFPALSTAVPGIGCFRPSVVTWTGAVQLAMPDSASVQVNVTVTAVLFHPAAFGGGSTWPMIVGGLRSMLTVGDLLVEFPAASVATT